jgi:tetratricopeptide (TPR) repeat protein
VYALGAILYELLTGRPPHRGATPLETLEQARSREPVPPGRLNPAVSRNLETICLKCLRKEPARRYASAADMAEDLARLQRGEPIHARAVGFAERGWAWCRRQPWVAGLAAALLLALCGGLTTSLQLWRRAESSADLAHQNERRARAQEDRAMRNLRDAEMARRRAERHGQQTRRLLVKCFQVSGAPSLRGPASQPVRRELLVEIEARYRQLIREQPGDRALRTELAEVTTSLGNVYLRTWHFDQAGATFRRALGLWQQLVREDNQSRVYRSGLAKAHEWLGSVHQADCCLPGQMEEFTAAYRLWQDLTRERPTAKVLLARARCASEVGRITASISTADALRCLEDAKRIATDLLAKGPANHSAWGVLAATYVALGELHHRDSPSEERRYWRLAYDQNKKLLREVPGDFTVMSNLARCCVWLSGGKAGDPFAAEAIALYAQALGRLEAQLRVDPDNTDLNLLLRSSYALGVCYQQAGQRERARRAFRRCASLGRELAARHPQVAVFGLGWAEGLAAVAVLEVESGHPARARDIARQAIAVFTRLLRHPANPPEARAGLWGQFRAMASLLRRRGAAAEAVVLAEQVKEIFEQLYRETPTQGLYGLLVSESWAQIAKSRWRLGQHDKTLAALRQALHVQQQLCDRFPKVADYRLALADRWFRLARFLGERGNRPEAARGFVEQARLSQNDVVNLSRAAQGLRALAMDVRPGRIPLSWADQAERQRYLADADRVKRWAAAALAGTVRVVQGIAPDSVTRRGHGDKADR